MKNLTRNKAKIIDVKFGENVKIIEPCNLYGCTIHDNVFVGPFVEIQENVEIGEGSKIQSHTFICSQVTIAKNVFVGHGVMFINDKFSRGAPAMGNKDLWEHTFISDNVYIGSNATILPVKICSNVVIGAGSVVTKDIEESGTYAGNPAIRI